MHTTNNPHHHTRRRRLAAAALTAGLLIGPFAQAAHANDDRHERGSILALGDSIAYGFNPNLVATGDFQNMRGYPEILARQQHRPVTNLACPGQSAQGMLALDAPDNGCFAVWRALGLPLHQPYTGTQIDAATTYLTAHPHTSLVTISAGGNDWGACAQQPATFTECAAAAIGAAKTALVTIVHRLRDTGYRGPIVLTTYYPFPTTFPPFVDQLNLAVRDAQRAATRETGALLADAWPLFEHAAGTGTTCDAGLLIRLPDNTCDLHPSPTGSKLLARAVNETLDTTEHHDH